MKLQYGDKIFLPAVSYFFCYLRIDEEGKGMIQK